MERWLEDFDDLYRKNQESQITFGRKRKLLDIRANTIPDLINQLATRANLKVACLKTSSTNQNMINIEAHKVFAVRMKFYSVVYTLYISQSPRQINVRWKGSFNNKGLFE